jgi:Ser/Thr protein kinase RdoA (MazF antagonist)
MGTISGAGPEAPTDDLLREVTVRYGIGAPVTAHRLAGGYANDVFRLDADGAPVVLHIQHPPVDGDSLDWEHRLVAGLAGELPEVPAPLAAIDGSTWFWYRDRPVWLVPWAPGGPAGPQDRLAVAAMLGRLHGCRIAVPERPNHPRLLQLPLPAIGRYPSEFAGWRSTIIDGRAELTRLVTWLQQERRPISGITHNDIFEGNVLVRDGRVSAVLDWEEADLDWQVWDLASSLWPFCSEGDRLHPQAVADFLAAYRSAGGPVPPDEEALIVPLVRAKRLLEVLRAPTDRNPQWEQQLSNLRAFAALAAG